MRVRIIGAGVAGLACAAEFAGHGLQVEVIERGAAIGGQSCSRLAGGMLAPWCEGESAEEAVTRLGALAADWWDAHVRGVERRGTLVVAPVRDSGELVRFAARTTDHVTVDGAAIAELEPDLAGRFRTGLFFPGEAHLCPRCALTALARDLQDKGVVFRLGCDGNSGGAAADCIIDCRGFAARDDLPELRGVRGEMVLVRSRDITLSRPVRLLHPRIPVYVVPRCDGLFMVGATMIESNDAGGVTARSAMELLGAAYALHPAFGEAEIVEMAAGIRPAFPDNLPRVLRRDGRIFVNGFYRHGFLLAPAFAAMAADAVAELAKAPETAYAH